MIEFLGLGLNIFNFFFADVIFSRFGGGEFKGKKTLFNYFKIILTKKIIFENINHFFTYESGNTLN